MPASSHDSFRRRRRNLDRLLFHGIAWTAASRWLAQIVSWAVLLYAARVLVPGDFGLAAMAMVAIGLARMIEDLGLDAAIVQNQDLDADQIASLGGLALIFGASLCLLYLFLAGLVARFYEEPDVANVIRVLSVLFVLDALQIVPRALLQKELSFGKLAFANGFQLTMSAVVLGGCTYFGLSYWSLVLNHIVSHVLVAALLYYLRPFNIRWPKNWLTIAQSVKFGGHMLVSRIAWYGYSTADQLFLGRIAGKDTLGAYSFALTFANIPLAEIGSLSGKVVPGIFSTVQHSRSQLTRYLLLLTEVTAYFTVPATIGIALVADDFVPLALGNQWSEAILPLKILTIYMCTLGVTNLWSHVLIWTGNARLNMYMTILALAVLPPAFYLGAHFGAAGVATAWVIVFPITLVPVFFFIQRILHIRFMLFLNSLGPALICTAVMACAVILFRDLVAQDWGLAARFASESLFGASVYACTMLLIFRNRARRMLAVIWNAARRVEE